MDLYTHKQHWKFFLFLMAIIIGVVSLWYTNRLVKKLSDEEHKKVQLWAEATRKLADSETIGSDFSFLLQVIQNNTTVPVILVDHEGQIAAWRNLDSARTVHKEYLNHQLTIMKAQHQPIIIEIGAGERNYIYYKNSTILYQLTYYPYIQLGVIILFVLVSYFAFSSSRKAEQNNVWVGLSKETAHQLGTPTSSLMALVEILKSHETDKDIVTELDKDVKRLEKVTDRFSKIGSSPSMKTVNLTDLIGQSVDYLRTRIPEGVSIRQQTPAEPVFLPLSASLVEWVLENVCKNAVDALEGKGLIQISETVNHTWVIVDITDNGKGMPRSMYKTIFKPGFTTKERGWGLGLSLSKRIIETYHRGKIFVLTSEQGKGTTIRIMFRNGQF